MTSNQIPTKGLVAPRGQSTAGYLCTYTITVTILFAANIQPSLEQAVVCVFLSGLYPALYEMFFGICTSKLMIVSMTKPPHIQNSLQLRFSGKQEVITALCIPDSVLGFVRKEKEERWKQCVSMWERTWDYQINPDQPDLPLSRWIGYKDDGEC